MGSQVVRLLACILLAAGLLAAPRALAADPEFQRFLQSVWPEAQKLGVSRETFDAATRGLEPDMTLPEVAAPGRPTRPDSQPEFVQTPADYVRESSIANLASRGKKLAEEHRAMLAKIEQRFGVPASILLAIWGRETGYGGAKLPHNAIRVLATQAYLGKRKDFFRNELLAALKILQDGDVTRADMRSSWAGAMGYTQLLPSDFFNYAVDFDGDGRRDIWNSIPDALASAAAQLVGKGWQRGKRWAYEVRMPPSSVDCTVAEPSVTMPIGEWVKRGFVRPMGGGCRPMS